MITTLILVGVAALAGFVGGILVGRRNRNKIDQGVAEVRSKL